MATSEPANGIVVGVDGWSGAWGAPLPEDFGPWQELQAHGLIKEAVRIARDSAGGAAMRIRTEAQFGPLVPTLVDMTKHAKMVVVGCRGVGAFSRAVLGSASTALVHHSHCPVAVVHGEAPQERAQAPIVLGVDRLYSIRRRYSTCVRGGVANARPNWCGDARIQ